MELRLLLPAEYPLQLGEIPDPPKQLWLRGSLPPSDHKLLAVVGSRALTRYGREACELLVGGLGGYPVSIVSGLALGADAIAHRAALDAGLHTIAIPGSGLHDDVLYPRSNLDLAHKILDAGGALISEQEPCHAAQPWNFPSRNRLMAGLAHAVLVIEAGSQSGSLITARLAGEYNRDLLCVPHRIGDPHAAAAHTFIRLGASHVTEPSHILEALGIAPRMAGDVLPAPINLTAEEKLVCDALTDPLERDELIRATNLPVHEALMGIGLLELKGVIKEEFGRWRRA
jgi:DNA processing protein